MGSIPGLGRSPESFVRCSASHSQKCPDLDKSPVPGASLVSQMVKNLPAVQETWVRSLGQKDPLEKGMATHSSILIWRIPWTEEPDYSPSGCKESDMTEAT